MVIVGLCFLVNLIIVIVKKMCTSRSYTTVVDLLINDNGTFVSSRSTIDESRVRVVDYYERLMLNYQARLLYIRLETRTLLICTLVIIIVEKKKKSE